MSESTQWNRVKTALRVLDPVRVENPALPGTPDVNFIGGWVELKQTRGWPAREDTVVQVDHFTPQQRIWLRRRWRMGGNVTLLLKVDRTWLLFDGLTAARIVGKVPRAELTAQALRVWENGLNDGELLSCLREISRRESGCSSTDSGAT